MYHITRNIKYEKLSNNQSGQILIFALVLMVIVTALVVSLVGYASVQIRSQRQGLTREQGLNIAEAGLELAIWKLNHQGGYSGEANTPYGGGTYSITVTNLSGSSKLVKADAYVPNSTNPTAHRTVQMTTTIGTKNIGFNYGLQVGNGGLDMDNNSRVAGNIYANNDIDGSNGATVTGTAIVAGPTGNIDSVNVTADAVAHSITNSVVGGNASALNFSNSTAGGNVSADIINNCTITGDAVYNSKTSCTVNGTSTSPNPGPPPDPVVQPLPIDQTQIDEWTQQASNGGVIASQTINGSVSLGPKEINGDLTVNIGGVLTITGALWVTGQVTIRNGATVQLASSYGSLSGTIIAGVSGSTTAGYINIENGAIIQGSGTAGSYMMLLSQRDTTSNSNIAISVGNTAQSAILYTNTGTVDVSNNAGAKEITAYKIHLNNNAVVTYESGLANSQFTTGPGGGWEYQEQTWQLLQ